MSESARGRSDAFSSAVRRLSVAVFIVEGARTLRPYNDPAAGIFVAERLTSDLLSAAPSHPLSTFIVSVLHTGVDDVPASKTLVFPSGTRYRVEASRRSAKGRERPLMLLIVPGEAVSAEALFAEWKLTAREKEVGTELIAGTTSDEICAKTGILPNTLKTHVRNILAKSGSQSRNELLARIVRWLQGQ